MASNSDVRPRLPPPGASGNGQTDEDVGQTAAKSSRSDGSASDGGHYTRNIDDENLGEHFQDQDLDALLQDAAQSEIGGQSVALLGEEKHAPATRSSTRTQSADIPKWMQKAIPETTMDEDDDVPESLLLDPGPRRKGKGRTRRTSRATAPDGLPPPIPGPSSKGARTHWRPAKATQELNEYEGEGRPQIAARNQPRPNKSVIANPKDKAMWKWANVQNLDVFLAEVYTYFEQKGIWSIVLRRSLSHLSGLFVIAFLTFLSQCVDYTELPKRTKLSEIVIPQCTKNMGAGYNLLLWFFAVGWIYMLIQYFTDLPRLWDMHNFYHHLLGIPDKDIQTVSWQLVVSRLMALRDANAATVHNMSPEARRFISVNSKQRMDAHDIANRLMRKENYMIALINRDAFDVTVPIPFVGNVQFWTRSIQWNIGLCLIDWVFNEEGQVKEEFLASQNRQRLITKLRARFFWFGLVNIVWAPFLVVFWVISYFFQYFAEYRSDPGQLSSRSFAPLAEWKFREFNELYHLFQQRKRMAYPFATQYLAQFPKDKIEQLARFMSFVTGALAAVLGLCSLLDPELFLGFEITPGKNVLFWLGVLGAAYTAARSQVTDYEDVVLDPWLAMMHVIEWTHYYPNHWHERLHSDEVRKEFSALFKPKIIIFLEEALSMIFAPYVLMIALPRCADELIDFFREFTVHIDGLGHVCSFAEFDFSRPDKLPQPKRDKNGQPLPKQDVAAAVNQDFYVQGQQKQALSQSFFLNAYAQNPGHGSRSGRRNWVPPPQFGGILPFSSPTQTHLGQFGNLYDGTLGMSNFAARAGGVIGAASGLKQSVHQSKTPRFGPQNHASPIHSVLLDPHNQPSAIQHDLRSPRQGPAPGASRFRSSRHTWGNHADDIAEDEAPVKKPTTTTQILEEDSMLGDSWRTNEAAADDEALFSGRTSDRDPGVLGMLMNFQKAHTEGRGMGL